MSRPCYFTCILLHQSYRYRCTILANSLPIRLLRPPSPLALRACRVALRARRSASQHTHTWLVGAGIFSHDHVGPLGAVQVTERESTGPLCPQANKAGAGRAVNTPQSTAGRLLLTKTHHPTSCDELCLNTADGHR